MKAAGGACILLGAFLGRLIALRERNRRRETLSDLRRVLIRMGDEIRAVRPPLPALLMRLATECGAETALFLRSVALAAEEGNCLAESWRTAAESLPLREPDRRAVSELGSALRGDETAVLNAVRGAAAVLESRMAEMDGMQRTDTRRTTALTFSAAALLVILLL